MTRPSFAELKENFIKSNAQHREQSGEKQRKTFSFRKKTNKAFSKRASGQKNKLLLKAIYKAFERYQNENLFFGELLNEAKAT